LKDLDKDGRITLQLSLNMMLCMDWIHLDHNSTSLRVFLNWNRTVRFHKMLVNFPNSLKIVTLSITTLCRRLH
jgi:hypothetical protein